jgi:hypothetical protein
MRGAAAEGGQKEENSTAIFKMVDNKIIENKETAKTMRLPPSYICGLVWCLMYGITRGLSYTVQKICTNLASPTPQLQYYPMFRCFFLGLFSYIYGKYTQGIDFSWLGWNLFRSYRWETQK